MIIPALGFPPALVAQAPRLPLAPAVSPPVAAEGDRLEGGTLSGDIRVHRQVGSQYLARERDVFVYLPPGYAAHPEKRYPVLYVHDGQNVFDQRTSAYGVEWGVDEAAQRLIQQGRMQDVIVVAVSNTPDRMSEYTPMPDPEHGGGNAGAYGEFLTRELKPFIDARYRTLTDASHTGVMGSSLGGLCSLYLGWKYPDTFGLVAALSPSLWWGHRAMIEALSQTAPGSGPQKVWLDMGTEESQTDDDHNGVPDVLDDTRAAGGIMLDQGYQLDRTLFYHEVPGARHNEASWAARVDDVLETLFPRSGPPGGR